MAMSKKEAREALAEALEVLPYGQRKVVEQEKAGDIVTVAGMGQGELSKARYWGLMPPMESTTHYLDLVAWHNDTVRFYQDLEKEYGDGNIVLSHAKIVTNHPDYFADFSQGLVWFNDETEKHLNEGPAKDQFINYERNARVQILRLESVAGLEQYWVART